MDTEDNPFNQASSGNIDAIITSLDNGFDINSVDDRGNSLLHWASFKQHIPLINLLLDRGISI